MGGVIIGVTDNVVCVKEGGEHFLDTAWRGIVACDAGLGNLECARHILAARRIVGEAKVHAGDGGIGREEAFLANFATDSLLQVVVLLNVSAAAFCVQTQFESSNHGTPQVVAEVLWNIKFPLIFPLLEVVLNGFHLGVGVSSEKCRGEFMCEDVAILGSAIVDEPEA